MNFSSLFYSCFVVLSSLYGAEPLLPGGFCVDPKNGRVPHPDWKPIRDIRQPDWPGLQMTEDDWYLSTFVLRGRALPDTIHLPEVCGALTIVHVQNQKLPARSEEHTSELQSR